MSADTHIDGRLIEPRDGETLLDASARLGIALPALCHAEAGAPEAGCRLCLVEDEADATLHAACHTPLRPGMRIRTQTITQKMLLTLINLICLF
jgi:formate dehydrogenase major subunit